MPKNNLSIGLDLEKLKTLHSGLGQFGLHFARNLQNEIGNSKNLHLYIPESAKGYFPHSQTHNWKRIHQITKIPLEVDVWHSLHQEAKYFPKKYKKLLVTIHDLNFLDKYEGSKLRKKISNLQDLVDRADGISFISKYTKNVANEYLNLGDKQQRVIYNGLTLKQPIETVKPNSIEIDYPYLFSIGIISAKKNFHTLIPMMKELTDLHLIIAGNNSSSYANEINQEIANSKLEHRIKLVGEVSEFEKNWLYENCEAFVFPSLSEGFGLPVIEAFYFGKPSIISNKSSLPEIGENYAEYFNDFEPKEMSKRVKQAISTHTQEKSIEQNKYALSYSWAKAAETYLRFYREV